MNLSLYTTAFTFVIIVLVVSGVTAITSCTPTPSPLVPRLTIIDGGITVPPSANRARVEGDDVILERTP